ENKPDNHQHDQADADDARPVPFTFLILEDSGSRLGILRNLRSGASAGRVLGELIAYVFDTVQDSRVKVFLVEVRSHDVAQLFSLIAIKTRLDLLAAADLYSPRRLDDQNVNTVDIVLPHSPIAQFQKVGVQPILILVFDHGLDLGSIFRGHRWLGFNEYF